MYLEATDNFPFLTKTVLENIHRNEERGCYKKLNDTKIVIFQEIIKLDECGLLSLFGTRWFFFEFFTAGNSAQSAMPLG